MSGTQVRETGQQAVPRERTQTFCFLCGSVEIRSLFDRKGDSLSRCSSCGLVFQNPPPPPDVNREYYEKNYYEEFGERNRTIQEARLSIYHKALSLMDRFRQTGRLLDVGSGYGDFLRMACKDGWEGTGLEPSHEAFEASQKISGVHIIQQTAETAEFPENHFDVVTLWNVLDCFYDPVSVLQRIGKWLRPGGMLLIRTPNAPFHVWAYRWFRRFYPLLQKISLDKDPSVFHRANFSARSLRLLLGLAGFRTCSIRDGKPSEGDPYEVFAPSRLMIFVKFLVYLSARLASVLTGNRTFVGSVLMVQCPKPQTGQQPRAFGSGLRMGLKRFSLHVLALLGYLLGLPLWLRLLGRHRDIRILLYHGVSSSCKNDMDVFPDMFKKQLDLVARHYEVVPLETAVGYVKKGERPRRPVAAITFDDGYEDNYRVALPLLKQKRFASTIFLLTGQEGDDRKALHLRDYLPEENRLLNWDQIKEMSSLGVSFGSHGVTHARLGELGSEELDGEFVASKAKIEAATGKTVKFFSYPYGTDRDFGERERRFARRTGYEAAFTAMLGANGPGADPFALRRIGIEASDSLFTFRAKLNGALSLLSLFRLPVIRRVIHEFDSLFIKFFLRREPEGPPPASPLLLVSVDFPPHTDGVSTISGEIAARLARRGKGLVALGPRDCGDREWDSRHKYRAYRVPGYEWGYGRFFPFLLCMPWMVVRHGIRNILAMNIAYGGLLAWMLSHAVKLRYLLFAYGYEFEKMRRLRWMHRLYLAIYDRAVGVVACSAEVRDRLILFGVAGDKIHVLYPAVDLSQYFPCEVPAAWLRERGLLEGRRILLTVGRLVERKGHDRVIDALPEILKRFPDVLYCVVGIGPHQSKLRDQVRGLGLEPFVKFLGKVSNEDLARLYNASSVFVMPSREIALEGQVEGFGIVYLEANACAKPVIGGRSGAVAEAVLDGQTGYLVNPDSPGEIAARVIELLSDPAGAKAMGLRGLERVRRQLDWDHYTGAVAELLLGGAQP